MAIEWDALQCLILEPISAKLAHGFDDEVWKDAEILLGRPLP